MRAPLRPRIVVGRPFVLVLASLAVACGAARGPARAAALAGRSGLHDVAFSPPVERGAGLVSWTATGGFHELQTFVERITEPLPDGCSAFLDLTTAGSTGGRTVLSIAGAFAPARRDAGGRPCAAWPTLGGALQGLANAIPPKAWVTEVTQDGARLEVSGLTAGGEDEARAFVRALAGTGAFVSAELVSVAPEEQGGRTYLRFRLSILLRE